MERFNIFQALYMSFYSRKLYRDVAHDWGARSFAYLLFLLALTWLVFIYQIQVSINRGYAHSSNTIIKQMPILTIKDGKVSTPENRPYILKDPTADEALMVIDTSGKYTNLDQVKTAILITRTKIYSQPKPNQQRIDEIPVQLNMVIVPDRVNDYIKRFVGFLWIPMFFLAVFMSFIYRIMQSLLYAIIGKLMALLMGVKLTYWQLLQIMIVAITPVIIVCTILRSLDIDVMHHNLFYFTLAMVYLAYGVYANKE